MHLHTTRAHPETDIACNMSGFVNKSFLSVFSEKILSCSLLIKHLSALLFLGLLILTEWGEGSKSRGVALRHSVSRLHRPVEKHEKCWEK